jgi:hypothetical protein
MIPLLGLAPNLVSLLIFSLLPLFRGPFSEFDEATMTDDNAACLVCKRASEEIPLISFRYKGSGLWICPQHLPILIHDPMKLADILPGADTFQAVDPHD